MLGHGIRSIGARPWQAAVRSVDAAQLGPFHNLPFAIMTRRKVALSTSTRFGFAGQAHAVFVVSEATSALAPTNVFSASVTLLPIVAPIPRKQEGRTTTCAAMVTCEASQHVVPDHSEVTDMIARPHDHVIADLHVKRDRLFVEDEAVFADIEIVRRDKIRVGIADKAVALLLGLQIFICAKPFIR